MNGVIPVVQGDIKSSVRIPVDIGSVCILPTADSTAFGTRTFLKRPFIVAGKEYDGKDKSKEERRQTYD